MLGVGASGEERVEYVSYEVPTNSQMNNKSPINEHMGDDK